MSLPSTWFSKGYRRRTNKKYFAFKTLTLLILQLSTKKFWGKFALVIAHQRNPQVLTSKVYKILDALSPDIMQYIYNLKLTHYWSVFHFYTH